MKKYCKEEILSIDNIPGIYLIKNTLNGKCYIGQSIYLKKRLLKHLTLSDRKMYDTQLYKDFQKYGLDVFEFSILETLNTTDFKKAKTQLDIWEKNYIIKYNSYENFGYNQTFSSNVEIIGDKFTENQKQLELIEEQKPSNKINMLYIYIIDGPETCKYITSIDLIHLNGVLKYHGWGEIQSEDLITKHDIPIYKKYILASSKEELYNKIKKYNENRNKC